MFTSLRSRLWLTYTLLIGGVVVLAGLVLVIFLLRAPISIARQRVDWVAGVIQKQENTLDNLRTEDLPAAVRRADVLFDTRILVLNSQGNTLADSRTEPIGRPLNLNLNRVRGSIGSASTFRDASNRLWVFTTLEMPNGEYLVITVRPTFPYLQLFRLDVLPPLLWISAVAILIAILLAIWISRWIVSPIQRITSAARAITAGNYHRIPVEGPEEVQELGVAFNEMTMRVQSSQKSQRDLVANVSHELKTPLTSIEGFAQAILDGTASTPETSKQAAGVIYSEAERMNSLVLSLLELARFDSGTVNLRHESVDLNRILLDVTNKLTPQARSSQVELITEIPSLPTISGDDDRLTQVVMNLLENAIKYTPAGGKVTITARASRDDVEINVTDNGPGIAQQDLGHIFERFYQADKSRRGGQSHGVGLGLAIAKEIVQAHKGTIQAESSFGKGTTFTIHLPVIQTKEPAAGKQPH